MTKKIIALFLAACLTFAFTACSSTEETTEDTTEETVSTTEETTQETTADYSGLTIGKADYAAHGTYSFAATTAVLAGDTIVAAYIDEYQYLDADTYTGVPNSDATFGEMALAVEKVLASKKLNVEAYSANMSESGGATQTLDTSWMAIEEFCVGKTITELEEWAGSAEGADVIAGSTLVDTVGYVKAVVEAAKTAPVSTADPANFADVDVKIANVDFAAHGTYCFTLASTAVIDDVIVATIVDDYQYLSATDYVGVPNSDATFGETALENDKVLASKRTNMEAYSANMSESGGATLTLDTSWTAIEEFCVGKTITELEEWAGSAEGADVIAGSTLVDTVGYTKAIIEAAKMAK